MARRLSVYLYEDYVGELLQDNSGRLRFTYASPWLQNSQAIPLSHSLPLRKESFARKQCQGFFSGMLPEGDKREQIARILGISARNDFALLEQIGGECAGAVTFLPIGEVPNPTRARYRRLADKALADVLRLLPNRPLMAGEEGVRLSLAGVQDKLAVMVDNDGISVPLENSPSTHILKPATDHFVGLIYNEAICLQLAQELRINAAAASLHRVLDIDYLLVKRYDRMIDQAGKVHRLHQEDFCQALGIVSEMKYQSEGGPSLQHCFDLVRHLSTHPVLELKKLLDAVIFNYLIGNHDAHGKNFSLLYKNKQTEVAPLYDLVCTVYYPELSPKMAMKMGGEYDSHHISRRHFERMAKEIGFSVPGVCERVLELSTEAMKAITRLKPSLKSSHSVFKKVTTLIHGRCERTQTLFK